MIYGSIINIYVKNRKNRFQGLFLADVDQSQKWLNCTGIKGGDSVGITKNVTAVSRWALFFNLRSDISQDTKAMFRIDTGSILH